MLIVLMLIVMVGFLVFIYYRSQSRLNETYNFFLNKDIKPTDRIRNEVVIRKERTNIHDILMLLEADLVQSERLDLTLEEIEKIDKARVDMKRCEEELENAKEWLGSPFDLNWSEILQRLPKVDKLYRQAILKMDPLSATGVQPEAN